MRIDIEDRGEIVVLKPEDRLDLLGYLELEETMASLLREGNIRLVLDLSNVGFMNSTSMAVIHRYSSQAARRGGGVVLTNVGHQVKGVLSLGGLDEVVPMCETIDEAALRLAAKQKDKTDKHKTGGAPSSPEDTRAR